MKTMRMQHVIWKEGRHYVAQCLNVDVSSFGQTKQNALENLNEALELYFEDARNPKVTKVERAEIARSLVHA